MSKVYIVLIVICCCCSVVGCSAKTIPISESSIYSRLQGVSSVYGFAHETIAAFSRIVSSQKKIFCVQDPDGAICRGALAYERVYRETLYPSSVKADEIWTQLIEAFEAYRALDNPDQTESDKVLKLIEELQSLIEIIKSGFTKASVSLGVDSSEIIKELDSMKEQADYMRESM